MITLKTLAKATKQEVFDQVARHLLAQNAKAIKGRVCKFRWYGKKCASGCLISDDEYKRYFDELGGGWADLVAEGHAPKNHFSLIIALQGAHDNHQPECWNHVLKSTARIFRVNQKVLREFA